MRRLRNQGDLGIRELGIRKAKERSWPGSVS